MEDKETKLTDKEDVPVYNIKDDVLAVLSTMMDTSFGPRMHQTIMDDMLDKEDKKVVDRYKPEGWRSVEEVKNVRAGFATANDGRKLLKITYHNVAVVQDQRTFYETEIDKASKIVDLAMKAMKKEFKAVTGKALSLKAVKNLKDGKDVSIETELVNNPRQETSWMNSYVPHNAPRIYYRASKFFEIAIKDPAEGDFSKED